MEYKITHTDLQKWTVIIEAENEDEAIDKAMNAPTHMRTTITNEYGTEAETN